MDKIFKIKWIKYLKLKKNKMVDIVKDYTKKCTPYVWMPAVHTQQKESMLCQTKGVSICPHTFGCPPVCWDAPNVWMASCVLRCPHMPPCMFGHPICLDAPVCFGVSLYWDAPCMLGHCHMFRFPHMFGWCLDAPCTYTTQRKCALSD